MNKTWKPPAGLDCPIALSGEFIAVDDDNVRSDPIMADKDILKYKYIIRLKKYHCADSDDENQMNDAAPVPHIIQNEDRHENYAQLFRRTFQLLG
ncbi:hypothetical protein TNCV_3053501 [Trichonephila clavipes]|uniref:Uncharacterized protein n=1 Tax=Trichonephila clavipes TaxID=2585209 RepID=A0A8X6V9T2_TRICX|nr:hypothetical protein TNCV_3053501 [Trichonephila clavipes]